MSALKLFAIYIGGEHPGAHIEVHDVRFVVARSIAQRRAALRPQWWGTPGTLHMDCWALVDHADGYDVRLSSEPFPGPERLYFVNLGGYAPGLFAEQHRNLFVVACLQREAKSLALATISGWNDAHKDDLNDADHIFPLTGCGDGQGLHVHLVRATQARALTFTCNYVAMQ